MKKLNPADLSFSIFLFYLLSISVRDVHRDQIQVHTEATKSSNLRFDHFLLLIVLGICSCCGINKTAFNQKRVLGAERDALARR